MMSGNQSYILYSQNAELHHAGWYVIHSLVFFRLVDDNNTRIHRVI